VKVRHEVADSTPAKPRRSPVRKVFDVGERAVANRAEPLARTGGFASVLGKYMSVNRRVGGILGKATGGVLHLVNIPTASDVKKLHVHLASVDTHIAEMIGDLGGADDARRPGDDPSPDRAKPAAPVAVPTGRSKPGPKPPRKGR
jgi:hypothetical protein